MAISKIQSDSITDSAVTSDKISGGAIGVSDLGTQVQGALGTRNLIINGDMSIAQRGTSTTGITAGNNFVIDRFYLGVSQVGTWSLTQDTDVPSGQGFANSLKATCTTAATPTGTQQVFLSQNIEAQFCQHLKYGTSNAEKITMSFWVKSNKTGNYIAWILCDDGSTTNTNYVYSIDAADTWEKKTITFQGNTLQSIANDNGKGLQVRWTVASGETYTSGTTLNGVWQAYDPADTYAGLTVNLADAINNYINITGVQLEVGDTATPFEHRPYDMELARCQRYFYIADAYLGGSANYPSIGAGYNISSTESRISVQYPVMMRAKPTLSYTGTLYILNSAGSGIAITSIASNYGNAMSGMVSFGVASGLTQGHGTVLITNNGSGQTFQASAEL